jgi:hypothetical protein
LRIWNWSGLDGPPIPSSPAYRRSVKRGERPNLKRPQSLRNDATQLQQRADGRCRSSHLRSASKLGPAHYPGALDFIQMKLDYRGRLGWYRVSRLDMNEDFTYAGPDRPNGSAA